MGGSGPQHDDDPRTHAEVDVGFDQPSTRPVGKPLIDPTHALLDTQLNQEFDEDSVASLAEIGTDVGRYRVLGMLGRGGMGVVLHAHDPELERELALKLLREHVDAPDSPRGRALLMREARAIARVSHPNVIAVYDVGVHRGRVYVVMELVRGRALHVWMRDGHPLSEVLEVFAQAARGLSAAHAAGLVHRDFKPANVLVGSDGRVRVLDFGLARPPNDAAAITSAIASAATFDAMSRNESLTIAGTLAGTPAYMSPEQFETGEADPRSDQFAFCVTLHEALFGTRPFTGDTLIELRNAVTGSALALPGSADGLPARLRELLRRGLAKHGSDRFENMDAIVEVLDEIRAELASSHDTAPIIAPLGYLAADSSSDRSRSSERMSIYLGTLPRGLDSHPQCSMHGGVLRFALARYPLDKELPEQVLASLEYLARADSEDPWIAEVPARVLLAAIHDRHIHSQRAWDALWFAVGRARFTRQFLGFTAMGDKSTLAGSLARLWNDFHRGTRLELTPIEGGLALVLAYPNGMLDALAHAEVLQVVSAGLQMCGHDRVEVRGLESDSRRLQATIGYR
jgi:serine/threonine protein kinase